MFHISFKPTKGKFLALLLCVASGMNSTAIAQEVAKAVPPSVVANAIYPQQEQLMRPFPNPAWGVFPRSGHDVIQLAPGLYTFRYGLQATRNIFMVTSQGVIVTDPINAQAAAVLRAEIRKITPLPVRYVVYSHSHWDHISGGQIFKDEGAKFIAQRNCDANLKANRSSNVVMPDILYDRRYTLRLGGRSLELYHFEPDASNCSTYMRPDGGDLMFVVDTVIPGRMPLGSMADTYPSGIVRTLQTLEGMPIKAIIPGHGGPIADRSAMTERRLYMEGLMRATRERLADPSPPLDLFKSIRVPEFSYLRGYEQDIDRNAERMVNYYYIGW